MGSSAPIRSRPAPQAAPSRRSCSTCRPPWQRAGRSDGRNARGERIPLGYALDSEGRPTTDPKAALGGVVLPIGGYKGSGLSMLMDILGGVISGAGFAGSVGDQYKVYDRPQDVGHFFLAMRPDLFMPEGDYRARMDILVDRIRNCPKAEGFDEILIPGEPETRREAEHRRTGIPYGPTEIAALQAEGAKACVPPLAVSERPLA
jgi:LDH2 family malate/lactate/ureidoglycolate dehydrogenase